MKERPILFSAPMVRALLAGTKTQTRRTMKVQPHSVIPVPSGNDVLDFRYDLSQEDGLVSLSDMAKKSPYGQPGDRLWVRETWRTVKESDRLAPWELSPADRLWFEADGNHQPGYGKTRVSIHMPRWASRITVEVTGVRVERLNDISVSDCCNEGAPLDKTHGVETWYRELWEQINGTGSWAANPFVWVVEFKRIEGGLDNVG